VLAITYLHLVLPQGLKAASLVETCRLVQSEKSVLTVNKVVVALSSLTF